MPRTTRIALTIAFVATVPDERRGGRRARAAFVIALAVAAGLAGCVSTPAAEVAPASVEVAAIPPLLEAEGASLTAVVGGVVLSWEGSVTPARGDPIIGLVPPGGAAESALYALTLPPEATLLHGWLNWTPGGNDLRLRVRNGDLVTYCGAFMPEDGTAECFATLYASRDGAQKWDVLVSPVGASADGAPIPFTLDLFMGTDPLPILGSPAPFGANASMQFGKPVLLSTDETHSAEPSIAVTPKGTIYVAAPVSAQRALWRSTDGGASFEELSIHGAPTDPGSQYVIGGGDSDVAVSGEDTVYFADQHVAETVSSSHDGGATWFTQPLGSGVLPLTDRQWLVTDGPTTAYLAFNGVNGATVSKTLDGGKTWPLITNIPDDNCFRGNLARAPDGTLYLGGCNGDGPGVAVSKDGALTWTWHNLADRNDETNTSFFFAAHLFVVATTDADGNAYVVWSDEAQLPDDTGAPEGPHGLNIWLVSSSDGGQTWSKPKKVNQVEGTYVLPWATGGAPGQVAVAYYGTRAVGHPERVVGDWYPIVAVTTDALAQTPVWSESTADATIAQYGPVCMRGSACGNARNLLDFFQIQADSEGKIHMAYVDGREGGNYRYANILYVGQVDGATLGGRSVDKDGGVGAITLPKIPVLPK